MFELSLSRNVKLAIVTVTTIVLGIYSLTENVSADTVIDDFTSARNNRFTDDALNFVVPSIATLSGVGRQIDSFGQWATLIGDNSFLTAFHRQPAVGATIQFFPGNDPNASPFSATVVSGGSRVDTADGSTDLYVGYLDRIVDPSIARYDFARDNFGTTPGATGTVAISPATPFDANQLGYIVGISQAANNSIATDQSVGLNRITGYAEDVEFQGRTNNDTLVYEYNDPSEVGIYVENEAYVGGGDSGAPNFIVQNGELLLLGVNSFQLIGDPITVIDPVTGQETTDQFLATGVTYTGNVDEEIDRLIAAAPAVSAVPEPSAITIFSLTALAFSTRRRRG